MLAPRLFPTAPENSCRRVAPSVRTSVPTGPRDLPTRLSARAVVLLSGRRDGGKICEAAGIEGARPRSGAGALPRVSEAHRSRRPGPDAAGTREGGATTRRVARLRCSAPARVAESSHAVWGDTGAGARGSDFAIESARHATDERDNTGARRQSYPGTNFAIESPRDSRGENSMARPYRQRGTVQDKVNLFAKVDSPLKKKVDSIADYLGVSQAHALELILEHTAIDANGRPTWFDGPARPNDDEELPLQSAS